MLIVKSEQLYCSQLSDTTTRDDKNDVISEKLVHCIFIFWVNNQNLTWWKLWVLMEKLTPFDEILR